MAYMSFNMRIFSDVEDFLSHRKIHPCLCSIDHVQGYMWIQKMDPIQHWTLGPGPKSWHCFKGCLSTVNTEWQKIVLKWFSECKTFTSTCVALQILCSCMWWKLLSKYSSIFPLKLDVKILDECIVLEAFGNDILLFNILH